MRYTFPLRFAAALVALLLPATLWAQGFLLESRAPRQLPRVLPPRVVVPENTTQYSIDEVKIDANVEGAVASVNVSQTFKNEGKTTIETAFVFPLPYDGAVDSMTLLVNGKEYPATLVDADEARKQYEEIVRKAKDPALLEWVGYGLFKTNVFPIPAGETRTVTMRYSQLLRSDAGLTEFLFPLGATKFTTKPVKKISFDIALRSDVEIKNVYSPTFDIAVDRQSPTSVRVQSNMENAVPSTDFRLFFDQNTDEVSAKVLSYRPNEKEDGYFLLLASPKIERAEEAIPRTIVFCIDVSGSMMGQKIEQARQSLVFVLSRLRDIDKFSIVTFSSTVSSYSDKLVACDAKTQQDAISFANSLRAGGGTNVGDALIRAFNLVKEDESANPKYLVFLSDGEPTVGEVNEMKLAQIARESNAKNARFFSFGVGYDVNARLLDRFVRDGRGQGEYVKDGENIEERVSAFYSKIEDPVLANVEILFTRDGKEGRFTNQVYPSGKVDLFAGQQLVATGRYSEPGAFALVAKGKVGDAEKELRYEGSFVEKSADAANSFVEKLWATRRVGEIIDELDLNGENEELINELVELAKKHGLVTPYTSFLALDEVNLNATSMNAQTAANSFRDLASNVNGMMGVSQRRAKQSLKRMSNLAGSQAMEVATLNDTMDAAMSADTNMGTSGSSMSGRSSGMGMAMSSQAPMRAKGSRNPMMNFAPRIMAAPPAPGVMADLAPESVGSGTTQNREKIRSVAGKTFFFKNGVWVDSSITEKQEKEQKPIEIKQFSDEYFALVAKNGQALSQYLVFDEPIALNFNGQLYNVVASDAK